LFYDISVDPANSVKALNEGGLSPRSVSPGLPHHVTIMQRVHIDLFSYL